MHAAMAMAFFYERRTDRVEYLSLSLRVFIVTMDLMN